MSKLILATSEKAMRGLTDKISSLKLTDFGGENVLTAGSYLKAALNLFRAHDKVPKDINLLLFKIFRESSTKEFNSYIASIESNLDTAPLFGNKIKMTSEDIIDAFESKYSDIIGRGDWEAKSTTAGQESGFSADVSDTVCFNCGKIGHTSPKCTLPKDEKATEIRRKLFSSSRDSSGGRGGRGHGKGGQGRGRGRGGGRGRGAGRGGNDSSKKPELSADEAAKKALKTPPKPGEDHEKTINGSKLKWCGRCGKWTDHKSQDHPSGTKDATDGSSKKDEAEGKLAIHTLTGAMEANF
jgi:hypothetical protein